VNESLLPQRQRFVEEYLVDLNATQAAVRAGYSPKTATEQGARLLANVKVQKAIQEAMNERSERTKVDADDVLRELARIGFSDAWNYEVDEGGTLTLASGAPVDATRAVASIKHKTRTIPQKEAEPIIEHTVEFRLWDKNTALANIGKHLGMFIDRHEVTGKDGEPLYKAYVGFDPSKV
jgi:phage terminase small subunit